MTADSITHKLKSSDATKENYPYDFELKIKHVLEKNQVSVCWEVVNHSDETMYFTIGGHPAFNVPANGNNDKKEDYLLTFNGEKSLTYLLLDPASGTALPDQTKTLELTDGTCHIDAHMFDNDALIFDNQIEKAGMLFLTEHLICNLPAPFSEFRYLVCSRFFICMPGAMDGKM